MSKNFKQYVAELNQLLKRRPELAECKVVTSKDEEGNGYGEVVYDPGVGRFEDGEFFPEGMIEDMDEGHQEVNAVCLN